MSPKVSESHLSARRQQILEAAYRCFGRKGFHPTTMRDICKEADLSAGAVYRYFPGKEHLVEALAACGRTNTRQLIESIDTPPDGPGALAEMLRTLQSYLGRPEMLESSRFDVRLWGEAIHTPVLRNLMLEALGNSIEPFADVVRRGQQRGEIDPKLDPIAAGRLLVALMMGLQVQVALVPDLDIEPCGPVVAALLRGSFATTNDGGADGTGSPS